jgi:peptidoglycan DL-endopeptidase CwlO
MFKKCVFFVAIFAVISGFNFSFNVAYAAQCTNGEKIAGTAMKYLGRPYEYGAEGPSSFDCSGLTKYLYATLGLSLPHSARAQSRIGKYISKSQLQPGDLVFFTTDGSGKVSHVGLYIGGGKFVQAPSRGRNVSVTSLTSGYFAKRYVTARRLL